MNTGQWRALIATTALLTARLCDAGVATDILNLTGGVRVKIAWQRDTGSGGDCHGGSSSFKLMGFDTASGSEFEIISTVGDYTKPLITHDGTRIVFTNRATYKVYVVNWSGGAPTYITDGFASDVWRDPGTGIDWVYVRKGGASEQNPVYRYQIANPSQGQLVWNATAIGHPLYNWFQLSADGTRAADAFPWANCGVCTPFTGNWTRYGGGCWTGMAPDNSYRMWIFDGAHKGVDIYDAGGINKRNVPLAAAAGLVNEVYHPRWSNHPRFLTMDGPYPNGIGGTTAAEIWFQRFNSGFTAIDGCVRVTNNSSGDYFPDAWIDPGGTPPPSPAIALSPTSLTFSATAGGANPAAQNVSVTNSGSGTLADVTTSISYGSGSNWLTVTRSGSGNSQTLANSVNIAGLAAGTYTATVSVYSTGASNSPQSYSVTLTVSAAPTLRDPENPSGTVSGLDVSYYELSSPGALPNFGSLTAYKTDTVSAIDYPSTDGNFATSGRADNVGAVFTGYVQAPSDGVYTFYTTSDDGSALYIGATKVVDNDGTHGMQERSGQIGLRAGKHALRVEFFEARGGAGLVVSWEGPGVGKQTIPASALFRVPTASPAIALSPSSLSFSATAGGANPAAQNVSVTNSGSGTLADVTTTISYGSGSNWLSVSRSGSGNSQTLANSVNISGLAAGTYTATVSVYSTGASNSPQSYLVTLTVSSSQQPGFPFRVNCGTNAHEVAGWSRDDEYVTGGEDFTFGGAPDTTGVTNAAPADVYRTCRHYGHTLSFGWVPNGTYTVRLHFYDEYAGGGRLMDYTIEGVKVLDDFSPTPFVATVREFTVTVSDSNGLQIVAEQGQGNDVFECGVEVLQGGSANSAPSVDAGADQTVYVGQSAWLNGTASDDGLPSGSLSYQWTKVSGPGSVSFASPGSAETSANFSAPGTYVLRLTVSDGALSASDEVTVTVLERLEPSISVISPASGEVWYVGTTRRVEWIAQNVTSGRIYYRTNSSASWVCILESVQPGSPYWQSFPWVVPDTPSPSCEVMVSGYMGECPDISGPFEIRAVTDTDSDGMDDGWEIEHFGDLGRDGTADADGDGLTDYEEFMRGTDPKIANGSGGSGAGGFSCSPAGRAGLPAAAGLLAACAALGLPLLRRRWCQAGASRGGCRRRCSP